MNLPVLYRMLSTAERRAVREEYIRKQGGKCAHCATALTGKPSIPVMEARIIRQLFPPGFLKRPVHLHHDQDTGLTIGAVHSRCNAFLWQYHGE